MYTFCFFHLNLNLETIKEVMGMKRGLALFFKRDKWQVKNIIIVFFVLLLIVLVLKESYAYFTTSGQSVAQVMAIGDIICEVTVDSNPNYVENNIAYFRIKVTNTKDGVVSSAPVRYQLTIQNETGSNGIFYYIDSEGNTSSSTGEYLSSITSLEYTFNTSEATREFKVYVKVPSGLKETVNAKVDLNAVQI